MDKVNKKAAVIDVAVPDSNIRKKERQKLEGYQGPKEQLERERGVKTTVVIGAHGAVAPSWRRGHSKTLDQHLRSLSRRA